LTVGFPGIVKVPSIVRELNSFCGLFGATGEEDPNLSRAAQIELLHCLFYL
jgi:hypothetical protein